VLMLVALFLLLTLLELQLLFVPKPKGSKDDEMPKSMNACIREMRDAESVAARSWEGFLSQQGGDCPVSLGSLKLEEATAPVLL
jgi:hypothetical protein